MGEKPKSLNPSDQAGMAFKIAEELKGLTDYENERLSILQNTTMILFPNSVLNSPKTEVQSLMSLVQSPISKV